MLSAALALLGAIGLRRGGLPRRPRGQAAALDRRHGRRRGIRAGRSSLLAAPRSSAVSGSPADVAWGALAGAFGVIADRAAVRVPRDRADEHPLAAHRGGVGDRADAVGALRRTARRSSPIGYARTGGRARRRRARGLHPRRAGGAAQRARARDGRRRGHRDRRVPHRHRPDERRERTRAARHEPRRRTSSITAVIDRSPRRRGAARAARTAASVLDATGVALGATPSGHADLEHAVACRTVARSRHRREPRVAARGRCGVLDAAANVVMLRGAAHRRPVDRLGAHRALPGRARSSSRRSCCASGSPPCSGSVWRSH